MVHLDDIEAKFEYQSNEVKVKVTLAAKGQNSLVTMPKFALFALKCIDMGLNDQDNEFMCHN